MLTGAPGGVPPDPVCRQCLGELRSPASARPCPADCPRQVPGGHPVGGASVPTACPVEGCKAWLDHERPVGCRGLPLRPAPAEHAVAILAADDDPATLAGALRAHLLALAAAFPGLRPDHPAGIGVWRRMAEGRPPGEAAALGLRAPDGRRIWLHGLWRGAAACPGALGGPVADRALRADELVVAMDSRAMLDRAPTPGRQVPPLIEALGRTAGRRPLPRLWLSLGAGAWWRRLGRGAAMPGDLRPPERDRMVETVVREQSGLCDVLSFPGDWPWQGCGATLHGLADDPAGLSPWIAALRRTGAAGSGPHG